MKQPQPSTPFSTPLSGSARQAEARIRNLFQCEKKRPPLPLLFLAALLILSCCWLAPAGAQPAAGGDEQGGKEEGGERRTLFLTRTQGTTPTATTWRSPLWSCRTARKPTRG